MRQEDIARFWARVDLPSDPDACWIFPKVDAAGYGYFYADARKLKAHRVAWESLRGPIPPGLVIDHLCRVRACVRPDHLEPCSNVENIRRGMGGQNHRNKTHCPQGHPYAGDNLLIVRRTKGRYPGSTGRECRTCWRARGRRNSAAYYARRKAKGDG